VSASPTPQGAFVVIAFVAPRGGDSTTLARRLLAGERPVAADERPAAFDVDALIAALRADDTSLGEPIADPDGGTVSLVAARGDGLDIVIGDGVVTITTDLVGVKPDAAEDRFARLLAVLRTLHGRHGMSLHLAPDGQGVDPEADHERLARAWISAARAGASEHIARLGEGRNMSLVALALIAAVVGGAATLPAALRIPLLVLAAIAIPLFGVLIYRRLRRGRDGRP
jgi:hypothetical protein